MSSSLSFGTSADPDADASGRAPVFAASIQPHGLLIVVRLAAPSPAGPRALRIAQLSCTVPRWLQRPLDRLLLSTLAELGGNLDAQLQDLLATGTLRPGPAQALQCTLLCGALVRPFEGRVRCAGTNALVIELEPRPDPTADVDARDRDRHDLPRGTLLAWLQAAVQRFAEAPSAGTLADMVVRSFRQMTGYDRCTVQLHEADHAQVIAEARDPAMASLLGLRVRTDDLPPADRQALLHHRVLVLNDVGQSPVELVPQLLLAPDHADASGSADPSAAPCWPSFLRCPSPAQLQSLRRLGVSAMLTVAIVRDGQLWGSIVCHHHRPRRVGHGLLTAAELMAEVVATRLAALDRQAHRQVASQVRTLESRLVAATAEAGDWSQALIRHPETLLQPLGAGGVVLQMQQQTLRLGQVPDAPQVAALLRWLDTRCAGVGIFHCMSLQREAPSLAALTPHASGVLAVRLSATQSHWLLWLRPEQRQSVTWAGEPGTQLSGGGAAARWPWRTVGLRSEWVEATARPWSSTELALAHAFGRLLVEIATQVDAVRLLIAEQQLTQLRTAFSASDQAVVVVGTGGIHVPNAAFCRLCAPEGGDSHGCADAGAGAAAAATDNPLPMRFRNSAAIEALIVRAQHERRAVSAEAVLIRSGAADLPLAVRAEPVPSLHGGLLGCVLSFEDLRPRQAARAALSHLEAALACIGRGDDDREGGAIVAAILANARQAAAEVAGDTGATASANGSGRPSAADLLRELESSAANAVAGFGRMLPFEDR